jgi:D-3-phosphoglycerate dehydrogenase / 2-oxoglutarate reductase
MNKAFSTLLLESIHPEGIELLSKFSHVENSCMRSRSEYLKIIDSVDAIIVKSVTRVDKELINRAKKLKLIGRAGTGTDNIDLEYAAEKNITVLTVPKGNSRSAAEFTVMQILCLIKNGYWAYENVKAGDFRRDRLLGRELAKMTVGLMGVGKVGKIVAQLLKGFGCNIIGYDNALKPEELKAVGVEAVRSFEKLIAECDILSFHCPLNETTERILDAQALALARPGLMIVNCARGKLIVNQDLINALNCGQVAAAALDVLDEEPPFALAPDCHQYTHPLLDHPQVIISPHFAASTDDAQRAIATDLARQMKIVLAQSATEAGRRPRSDF